MIKTVDLFAGCGGLSEGFEQSGLYEMIAAVEWDKAPVECLRNRMKTKWGMKDADERVMRFDMQRTQELLEGWSDDEYGNSKGLDYYINQSGGHVDLIIGGPPCQAYSIAGRIRDENGMRDDYRNYLFESYLEVVKRYRPTAFVFENVPGILSAKPGDGDKYVVDLIRKSFLDENYAILPNLKDAVIDMSEYGIPQNRKRVIILGLNRDIYGDNAEDILKAFYSEVLPKYKVQKKKTVMDAIGDLPKLYPLPNAEIVRKNGKRYSHTFAKDTKIKNHLPRFHSERDIKTFRMLCEDIEKNENKYISTDSLKELYTKLTGKESNIHKFYVLRRDEPSNLIPAHLYKDGLRHIHPDSKQARSITVREAARLQTFPDDFEFISNSNLDYKMIGNAVPPDFARIIGDALKEIVFINQS